ncbi:MAG: hypothetical protein BWY09_01870 [Candidatus Hydrogenedentes bacterium ADurb.Bin179]|nr:MAG: hypothetical protein BWY09_01870 [Candidatus Hydrogenedentes bacterium ADurb.Bin179]
MIADRLEVTVFFRAVNAVLRAVGVHGLNEIPLVRSHQGKSLPGKVPSIGVKGSLVAVPGHFLQFNETVQGCDISDRQTRKIGLVVGVIRFMPAGITRREEIAGRPGQKQIICGIATGFNKIGAPFQQGEIPGNSVRIAADK